MFDYRVSKQDHFDEANKATVVRHKLTELAKEMDIKPEILRNKFNPAQPHKLTCDEILQIPRPLYGELLARKGAPSSPCYKQFYRVIRLAGIELPEGQMTHVLRHTFATHFMMAGGNIIVPQSIIGHSDIRVTMRYAHFARDHLEDAIYLNPLAKIADNDILTQKA